MNQNHHIKYFKVENFKRLASLELANIGQFNLIVGDNNVGKTSLLEALLFDTDRTVCLNRLHKTLILKGIRILPSKIFSSKGEIIDIKYPRENFLTYLTKDINHAVIFETKHGSFDTLIKIKYDPFSFGDNNGVGVASESIQFDINQSSTIPNKESEAATSTGTLYEHCINVDIENLQIPLISVSLTNNTSLSKRYFEQVSLSRKIKQQLIDDMRFMLPDIVDFEVREIGGEDQLLVGISHIDELMPISTFGESVTRATQILLEIAKYRGNRLMIDEIDTGIHYSRMKDFLKKIFQVAHKNDVQLFMTTHSLECQQAFIEVFQDADMIELQSQARQFTLIEKQDKQVKAIVRDFEQIQNAIETDYDTRGGKRGW